MPDPNPPDRPCEHCRPLGGGWSSCGCGGRNLHPKPRPRAGSRDVEARAQAQAHADTLRPQDDTPRTQNVDEPSPIVGETNTITPMGLPSDLAFYYMVNAPVCDHTGVRLGSTGSEPVLDGNGPAPDTRRPSDGVGES